MYYLFEAQSLDPSLLEAASRLEAYQAAIFTTPEITIPELSAPVSTGNIGRDARNELAQYKAHQETLKKQQEYLRGQRSVLLEQQKTLLDKQQELIALLHESEGFYKDHPPFEIIYDPALERIGEVNYQKETIDLRFRVAIIGVPASLKVMQSILDGLEAAKQGFVSINTGLDKVQEQLDRVNDAGKAYAVQPVAGVRAGDKNAGVTAWAVPSWAAGDGRTFTIKAVITNEQGKTIGNAKVSLENTLAGDNYTEPLNSGGTGIFEDVPVNDIDDVLKVTIKTVNDVDMEDPDNAGYIRVSAINNGYTASGYDINGCNKSGRDPFGYDKAGYDKAKRDRQGYDKAGYDKDGYNRQGYNKAGYDKAGRDMWGYDKAGRDRQGYDKAGYDKDGYNRQGYNKAGYDREGRDRQGDAYFDNAKKSDFFAFFTLDTFSPNDMDGQGVYFGGGLSLLFGTFGVWGGVDALVGEFDAGNDGYEDPDTSIDRYRLFLGINFNIYKYFSIDVGLGLDGKPEEKIYEAEGYDYGKKYYARPGTPVINMVRGGVTWYWKYLALLAHANYNFDSKQLSFVFGIGVGGWGGLLLGKLIHL
jgi:hypothetical protein